MQDSIKHLAKPSPHFNIPSPVPCCSTCVSILHNLDSLFYPSAEHVSSRLFPLLKYYFSYYSVLGFCCASLILGASRVAPCFVFLFFHPCLQHAEHLPPGPHKQFSQVTLTTLGTKPRPSTGLVPQDTVTSTQTRLCTCGKHRLAGKVNPQYMCGHIGTVLKERNTCYKECYKVNECSLRGQ